MAASGSGRRPCCSLAPASKVVSHDASRYGQGPERFIVQHARNTKCKQEVPRSMPAPSTPWACAIWQGLCHVRLWRL